MSSHHDHDSHHVTESKPVSFRVPLIMGLVTILLILLLVSTCDGGHHKAKCECKEDCSEECMKKCEAGDHSGHEGAEHETAATTEHEAATEEAVVTDTTHVISTEPAKMDSVAHEAKPAEEHVAH